MSDEDKTAEASNGACLTRPLIAPDDPAAVAVRASLTRGGQRMRECGPGALEGDIEGVHRLRTSSRRLRSELRTYRDLLDPHWSIALEDELKWLGGLLGAVRDLDVLKDRLRQSAGELLGALGPLFLALDQRHASASRTLRDGLQGERYRDLLRNLAEAATAPALKPEAEEPCRVVLPSLVAGVWKSLKKRGRDLGPDDSDEDFHEVRKRVKRARYAAEAVAEALDGDAACDALRFAKRANTVQDVLGEHQDTIVAVHEIQRIADEHPSDGPFQFTAGRLAERQDQAARDSRARFFKVWNRLDRKKNLRWLKP
jgi:CHAD domain-containing protein